MAVKYYLSTDASAPTLNGTAGSLITVLDACLVNGYGAKTALGWTKSYSGTNKAAYKSSDVAATGCLLRVDDSNAQYGLLRGYETMSDVDTGNNQFPTAAQFASVTTVKSSTANGTARSWAVIGDERMVYVWIAWSATYTTAGDGFIFGDIASFAASDPYGCILAAATAINGSNGLGFTSTAFGTPPAASYPHHFARNAAGTGTAADFRKFAWNQTAHCSGYIAATNTYPAPVDSGVHLHQIAVTDASSATNGTSQLRGTLPGAYEPWEYNAGTTMTTTTIGSKTYLILAVDDQTHQNQTTGRMFFDVTGPWR